MERDSETCILNRDLEKDRAKLKTFENKRIKENDFSMKHPCSFCPAFVSMVVQIPETDLIIRKSCLTKMIETIDSSIIRSTQND